MFKATKEIVQLRSWLGVCLVILVGCFLAVASEVVQTDWLRTWMHTLGVTVFIVGTVAAIQGILIRRDFIEIVKKQMIEVIDEKVPASLKNLHEAGIYNAYPGLEISKFTDSLRSMSRTEIRILKIWIPEIYLLEEPLYDALERRDCRAQVILLDPSSMDAIQKRAECLHCMDANMIKEEIQKNINVLNYVKSRLTEPDRLELLLHDSLISLSMVGTDGEFRVGFYLNGKLATAGPQLKIRGAKNYVYQAFNEHFEREYQLAKERKRKKLGH